ncbi:MAG: amidohydrolase [Planctomycetaceae bacterium]|nr:amidohydrolase [Planctomycetaceae bacterium]
MNPKHLHYVWNYTDFDHGFWEKHLADWLPETIIDAHVHIAESALRRVPMTDEMRRQYWVSEVIEPIAAETLEECYRTVFPGKRVSCLAFGMPDLDYDIAASNEYVQKECSKRDWRGLSLLIPQWDQKKIESELSRPGIIGMKPYYAMIGQNRDTRDQYIEASIYDFLPHHALEVLDKHHAWVTLHVPKSQRLGHPDNIREIREIRNRYPGIVLVIAHLGRCYTEKQAREGILPLADDSGLYFDTSAVVNPDSHRVALEAVGTERLIYGSDNPVFFMRGRRQFTENSYINRTNHDFFFNKARESPEIEAHYTLMMYEDIFAIKTAMQQLGISDRTSRENVFHLNAAKRLNQGEVETSL